jgi:hypothetical protein
MSVNVPIGPSNMDVPGGIQSSAASTANPSGNAPVLPQPASQLDFLFRSSALTDLDQSVYFDLQPDGSGPYSSNDNSIITFNLPSDYWDLYSSRLAFTVRFTRNSADITNNVVMYYQSAYSFLRQITVQALSQTNDFLETVSEVSWIATLMEMLSKRIGPSLGGEAEGWDNIGLSFTGAVAEADFIDMDFVLALSPLGIFRNKVYFPGRLFTSVTSLQINIQVAPVENAITVTGRATGITATPTIQIRNPVMAMRKVILNPQADALFLQERNRVSVNYSYDSLLTTPFTVSTGEQTKIVDIFANSENIRSLFFMLRPTSAVSSIAAFHDQYLFPTYLQSDAASFQIQADSRFFPSNPIPFTARIGTGFLRLQDYALQAADVFDDYESNISKREGRSMIPVQDGEFNIAAFFGIRFDVHGMIPSGLNGFRANKISLILRGVQAPDANLSGLVVMVVRRNLQLSAAGSRLITAPRVTPLM